MTEKTSKKRWLRRRGALAGSDRTVRITTAIVLAVSCAALAFTQLGFAGIGLPGEYSAYAIILLLPIALAALLLGTVAGTLMGLLAGLTLYAHAVAMPLDFYELTFVTPFTSIAMLTISGFLLGILFAFSLRNNPSLPKCILYITIVCIIVSWIYSVTFLMNAFALIAMELIAEGGSSLPADELNKIAQEKAIALVLRIGDINLQAWADAALMAVFCIAGEFAARRITPFVRNAGLRATFAIWQFIVVFIAFLVTSGAGFAATTQKEITGAAASMKDEVNYLCEQLNNADKRFDSLSQILADLNVDLTSVPDSQLEELSKTLSTNTLLDGYSAESDGTIFVMVDLSDPEENEAASSLGDNMILISDDDRFVLGDSLKDAVDSEVIAAIEKSLKTGDVERAVYDGTNQKALDDAFNNLSINSSIIRSEITYLYAQKSDYYAVVMMLPASKVFAARAQVMLGTTLSALVLLAALFAMTFLLIDRVIVRRIDETNAVLARITKGDLDAKVEVRKPREFASLSDGVNETVGALKGWISEAETRMDAELATAKEIQESALPRVFPPYPDILKFDIYATMHAAKEVGGDFYDFFLIGDADSESGKLGFVMADVSGKGVPAALFMMKAKTQLRDYLNSGMEIGEAFENTNRQLCDGNDAGMFVTVWAGVLDYASNHIDFVNAGHNPPLLWQKNTGWRWLAEKSGMPLGLFDGFGYDSYSIECSIGDELLLYTDGVTEAMNRDGELFGEDRLEQLANESYTMHPRLLVEAVRHAVARHAAGAEQSDDITILALEIGVPPEATATIIVPADVNELPRVNEFIHTELDRRLCPLRVQNQLDIAVEELFVNVAHYAYPDATPDEPGSVRVSYTYSAEPPSITVHIADNGIPYNPLEKPDAVTPDDIMDVPIGGLGILMAKRSVDDMRYERVDDSNVLMIAKKW